MKFSNVASPMGLFCTCFLVIALSLIMAATTCMLLASAGRVFKVGGELGWRQPGVNNSDLYTWWATRNRFQVGDSLSFDYRKDSVIEVDKWGYYHCNATQPILVALGNGNSVFKLDRPGPFYYISGILNNCKKGQRLLVEVMGFHHNDSHQYSPPYNNIAAAPPDYYSYLAPSPQAAHPTSSAAVLASVKLVGFVPLLVSAALWFICC